MFGLRIFRRFRASRDGSILVLVAMSLAVFLGLVALSFDFGRVASTQSELQSFADNIALAAAGELDGGESAITRATDAAANLISDSQTFGEGGRALDSTDYVVRFLNDLPAGDQDDLAPYVTIDPAEAVYAWVVVNQHSVDMPFAEAFAALTGNAATNAAVAAQAVAGFTTYACDVTPLMFCLPGPDFRADEHVGEMIKMRSGGSSEPWGPGNFGFVDLSTAEIDDLGPCEGLSNVQLSACLLGAQDYLTQCFSQRGIDTKPGQNVGNLETAVNVRFDIYEATMKGEKSDPDYAPAPNVVKGTMPDGGQCKLADSPDTVALPRDACFASGTCTSFGDGVFSWADYISNNHSGTYPGAGSSASTRYEMYLAEIAAAGDISNPILPGKTETGRPHCASAPTPNPKRRVVVAAGVNCDPAAGGTEINGAENGVPVQEFFELFLTEPAGADPADTSKFDIYAEIIGSASSGSAGLVHDVVQLYR